MDAGAVGEGIGAGDGFVGWNGHSEHVGDHAAGAEKFARLDPGAHSVVVGTGADAHDDLFQSGVAGPFADSVDGAFHLACAIANAGERVNHDRRTPACRSGPRTRD